jgi:hypothetical protein
LACPRCCWLPEVVGVSAVVKALLLLACPRCCWSPEVVGISAVVKSPAIVGALAVLGSLLLLASLLLLLPCCCWRLRCCRFPSVGFPDFRLWVINHCFESKLIFHSITRKEIPNFFHFLGMVRNEIPNVSCSAK